MTIIYETESSEGKIRVYEEPDGKRILRLGSGNEIHSMWDPQHVLIDVYEENYWNYFSLLPALVKAESVLMIGLGTGTVARQLNYYYPDLKIDAVEIDEKLVEVGTRYFEFNPMKTHVIIMDGLKYLCECTKKYDIVILDAFKGGHVNKLFLTTEVFEQMKKAMNAGGVFATNYYEGLDVPHLMKRCLGKTFSHIERVPIPNTYNYIVVASESEFDLKQPARVIKDKALLRIARYVAENAIRDR